jgi:hypothetical protein
MNPEPTDLVTTLRRESFYRPTSRLNEFGKPQMGFEMMSLNLLAADEIERLRARVEELEGIIDWHIDMVVGDAWLCRIEGKYEDIADLLGNAVGKQISAYEIDTSHHESTDP